MQVAPLPLPSPMAAGPIADAWAAARGRERLPDGFAHPLLVIRVRIVGGVDAQQVGVAARNK